MNENKLANIYLKTLTKWTDEKLETASDMVSQNDLWELSQKLAHIAALTKNKNENS